eukprot:953312-Pyramimonas_sp.AAC.1
MKGLNICTSWEYADNTWVLYGGLYLDGYHTWVCIAEFFPYQWARRHRDHNKEMHALHGNGPSMKQALARALKAKHTPQMDKSRVLT